MKLRALAVLLFVPSMVLSQANSVSEFSGIAVNTTNSANTVAAPIQIDLKTGDCTLTVSSPLTGSGACRVRSFDTHTGLIEIVSFGPPVIVWSGTLKGNFFSGSYKIDVGSQSGYFYLALLGGGQATGQSQFVPPTRSPLPNAAPSPIRRGGCSPAIESTLSGEIHGWDGETIFKLDNGQIWQQAEYAYTYFYAYRPEVTIYETSAGCRMKIEDEDETVVVRRIK